MTKYVYPFVFRWEAIIPADYPFIKVQGPGESTGVLLVFDDMDAYLAYCENDYYPPLIVAEQEKSDGQFKN